jgi:ABC-type oligopeptide transport system ATPase subunit
MVELADADELFAHPMHPYTKSLLSAIPLPDPRTEKVRKRIKYNALENHDYTVDKPSLREIAPNHFVMCNDAEEIAYKAALAGNGKDA